MFRVPRCISKIYGPVPGLACATFSTAAVLLRRLPVRGGPPRSQCRRIILLRHGESLGNVDEAAYTRMPDWQIPLTPHGMWEAEQAGVKLKKLVGDGTCYFYLSPYLRSQQTLTGLLSQIPPEQLTGIREEPRLSEQQFGNFQDYEAMQCCKQERRKFGRFFYRFPNGEAGLDVYNRVTSFLSTLLRDPSFFEDENIVLVTHGLTIRLFLMRWYQWSVQRFEATDNPGNCAMLVMELLDDGEDKSGGRLYGSYDLVDDGNIFKGQVPRSEWAREPTFEQYTGGTSWRQKRNLGCSLLDPSS
eukprot:TRINITY_DN82620_c0_g1_i1.p1 TRINITY_DN82620_c0_g1~~TRINITY_DN82620_c0_g1_i1.p1  ORF type:complete len:308 (-),score=52.36 TRINITY_DN82620_c0_g1_i1:74-976(-)